MPNPNPPNKFVPGDKRINRKGRPKSFDKLRELALSLAHEQIDTAQGPMTAVEVILRQMAKDPKQREIFLQYAFGKIPDKLDVSGSIKYVVKVKDVTDG